ncbi:MAG: Zn-ribbon domain-containing OB-fold protein [Candidatus Binatia bacterium]
MIEGIPLPATDDPADAAFWQAALRGELVVQACSDCGTLRFPPRPMCPGCQSVDHRWQKTSGRGRIWSVAFPHPPLLPAFADVAPFNVVVVALDEDPRIRIVGNVVATEGGEINEVGAAEIVIGRAVRVAFQEIADGVALPRWILD